jgi:ribosomal protein S12 methylthiotransferase
MRTKRVGIPKVEVITLGCSKNIVDSEILLTQLHANDIPAEHESANSDADYVVINTCGFIENAKEESINTILAYIDEKKAGNIEKLLVTGCLSHRYKEELEAEMPEVDAFFGTLELPGLLKQLGADYKHNLIGERETTTPFHYSYLKISEGCNRPCSFCAIPLMRGKHVSKPLEQLEHEAKNLAKNGTKEIMLIAQDTTYYGLDLYKKRNLADCMKIIADVEGIDWVRLHYAYPSQFPMDVIDLMAEHPSICNYLDMPLQHISDPMLKSMRRGITKRRTLELLTDIRSRIPNIALRTTLLVGHPGETDQDFEELCDFVREQRFERLGVFTYSHEDGTHAHTLEDDVPQEVKEFRAAEIMRIQEEISKEKNAAKIGESMKVLVDRKEGDYFIARSEADSPEVDNEILISAENTYLRQGDFAEVEIVDSEAFDLFAVAKS